MSILLSNNPPHAGNICDGIKNVEWRKKPLPKGRTLIYETLKGGGCGMVIGECEIVGSARIDPKGVIKDSILKGGCVDREFLICYACGKDIYANFCVNAKRYENPIPLSEFYKPCVRDGADALSGCFLCNLSVFAPDLSLTCNNRVYHPPQSWCYIDEN